MGEDLGDQGGFFRLAAMIFKAPAHWGQCSRSISTTRLPPSWGAQQAPSLCLAFPLAPAELLRPSSLMVLLFVKVTGIDSNMGLPLRATAV